MHRQQKKCLRKVSTQYSTTTLSCIMRRPLLVLVIVNYAVNGFFVGTVERGRNQVCKTQESSGLVAIRRRSSELAVQSIEKFSPEQYLNENGDGHEGDGHEQEEDDSSSSAASLRSVTFSRLPKNQEPHLLANFLMELGACSTSITDADYGTDQETPIFDEFDRYTMARTYVRGHVWEHCDVTAHFPASTSLPWIMEVVQDACPSLPKYDQVTNVEDRDWVLHVQQSWKPTILPPFVLKFPWHSETAVEEAIQAQRQDGQSESVTFESMVQLELQGGIAFGTGEHPTTQLCLEFVYNVVRPNMLIMDYGAGSGVLGIAACKLDATVKAIGVDIDMDAVQIANSNAEINHVNMKNYLSDLLQTSNDDESTSILLKAYNNGRRDTPTESFPHEYNGPIFDACVANILAAPLISLAPTLAGLLKPGAPLGLSGIMSSQADMILESIYMDYFDNLHVQKELRGWVLIAGVKKACL
jgi:ribosomal protein L11 methyltransferase